MSCCGPCEASVRAAALMGDPLARARLEHGARIGGWLPTVVWPSDVDREKARLDPSFRSTDAAVAACGGLSPAARAGWVAFYAGWRDFASRETPLFGASNEWEEAQRYGRDLAGWQETVRTARCEVPGPVPTVTDPDAPVDLSPLKWVAAAVVVAAAAYGVSRFV